MLRVTASPATLPAHPFYPPIRAREIARIVGRTYGYKTNHHTVKAFLERNPILAQLPLPLTGYHQFDDAYRARWTVVRLF